MPDDQTQMSPNAPPAPPPGGTQPPAPGGDPAPGAAPPPAALSWAKDLTLDADTLRHPSLGQVRDVADLARQFVNAQTMIGRKGAIPPKEGDAPQVVEAWRKAIGVPPDPAGYKIERPANVPEPLWQADQAQAWGKLAHDVGLTPAQEAKIREWQLGNVAGRVAALNQAGQRLEAELRHEWGGDYDGQMKLADRAIQEMGFGAEVLQQLRLAGVAADALRGFAKIGAMLGEDQLIGAGGGSRGAMSAAELDREIATLRNDPAYMSRSDRRAHEAATSRMRALQEMKHTLQQRGVR
jgi:hypothetical protein